MAYMHALSSPLIVPPSFPSPYAKVSSRMSEESGASLPPSPTGTPEAIRTWERELGALFLSTAALPAEVVSVIMAYSPPPFSYYMEQLRRSLTRLLRDVSLNPPSLSASRYSYERTETKLFTFGFALRSSAQWVNGERKSTVLKWANVVGPVPISVVQWRRLWHIEMLDYTARGVAYRNDPHATAAYALLDHLLNAYAGVVALRKVEYSIPTTTQISTSTLHFIELPPEHEPNAHLQLSFGCDSETPGY
jgi:hypothetical protein